MSLKIGWLVVVQGGCLCGWAALCVSRHTLEALAEATGSRQGQKWELRWGGFELLQVSVGPSSARLLPSGVTACGVLWVGAGRSYDQKA